MYRKRKFNELESGFISEEKRKLILKKRKNVGDIQNNPTKFLKVNSSSVPRVKEYICFKHDHQETNCKIYDCSGVNLPHTEEEITNFYLL